MGRNNVFQKQHYIEEWRGSSVIGVTKQLIRDLKYSRQRIIRGFSDADTWNIDHWFLRTMEEMLSFYKDNRHGSPGELGENVVDERGILVNETCHEEWDKILDQMIHLLREADEETTSEANAYDAEYERALAEFTSKYGTFGERLEQAESCNPADTAESRKKSVKRLLRRKSIHHPAGNGKTRRFHSMSELPEYKDISDRYSAEEDRIYHYRDRCKDEFMDLFRKWFWALWD